MLCAAWCTMQKVMDAIKKFYVTQYHGFEPLEICAATLLFEGSDEEVRSGSHSDPIGMVTCLPCLRETSVGNTDAPAVARHEGSDAHWRL